MDRATLNTYIDTNITNKTTVGSLTPTNEGDALKAVADYIDQEILALPISAKTSGPVTLSVTPSQLPYDVNYCSFGGGIGYLATTTTVMKEVIVIALGNINIMANSANTNFMFEVFNTFVNGVSLATNETWRFTFIGSGYWKAEKMN